MPKLTIDIKDEDIRDLLCSAFDAGVGYWCCIVDYKKPKGKAPAFAKWNSEDKVREEAPDLWPGYTWYPLTDDGAVVCSEDGDEHKQGEGKKHKLDKAAIKRGLKVMAEKYPQHFANFMGDHADAETGDVFVQCCLLGEIVYG